MRCSSPNANAASLISRSNGRDWISSAAALDVGRQTQSKPSSTSHCATTPRSAASARAMTIRGRSDIPDRAAPLVPPLTA
jgi:hypothetical protein